MIEIKTPQQFSLKNRLEKTKVKNTDQFNSVINFEPPSFVTSSILDYSYLPVHIHSHQRRQFSKISKTQLKS